MAPRVVFPRYLKHGNHGRDVYAVQRALARARKAKLSNFPNGSFGNRTGALLRAFQKQHGLKADGVYGPATHAKLSPYFDSYGRSLMTKRALWQAEQRKHQAQDPSVPMRQRIVAAAWSSYRNRWRTHYTQAYPWRMIGVIRKLPVFNPPQTSDCSGRHCWHCLVGGAEDPSGFGFNGYGFTGSFRAWANAHGLWTRAPLPGDQVHYGPGTGRHVATVIGYSGGQLMCVSHGADPMGYFPVGYAGDIWGYVTTRPRGS